MQFTQDKRFNLIFRSYSFIAIAVYSAVLIAAIVDWLYGGIGVTTLIDAPQNLRFSLFLLSLISLIMLEFFGLGEASFSSADKTQPLAFAARLIFLALIFMITDLIYTRILFFLIILYSYLSISRWLSYATALIGASLLFWFSLTSPVQAGLLPAPVEQIQAQGERPTAPPRPNGSNNNLLTREAPRPTGPDLGSLIDASMGSLITIFFTLLLARTMAQALKDQGKLEGLNASLAASHSKLQQYSSKVAELATTEERNRLARDIHDSLGHHLAAINIQLEKADAYKERDPQRSTEALQSAKRTVQDALKDVRESVSSLREKESSFSFDDALTELISRMNHSQLTIHLNRTGNSSNYSQLGLVTLYRVIQEGLTNVHKHAQASEVILNLHFGQQTAELNLKDNGAGFDTSQTAAKSFGIQGLRERLTLVNGKLELHSSQEGDSKGTSLSASIPKTMVELDV